MLQTGANIRPLTPTELGTVGGGATAVVVITQGLHYAFGWNPRYLGLLLSLLAAFFAVWVSDDHSAQAWIVAVPNAFIIYAAAAGLSGMASTAGGRLGRARAESPPPTEEVEGLGTRRFWTPWFR